MFQISAQSNEEIQSYYRANLDTNLGINGGEGK